MASFRTHQELASADLTGVLQGQFDAFVQHYPDATICQQGQTTTVPGGVPGALVGICFTDTAQDGTEYPEVIYVFAGLVQGSSSQLLVEVKVLAPQNIDASVLENDTAPVLQGVQWLQLS